MNHYYYIDQVSGKKLVKIDYRNDPVKYDLKIIINN